MYATEVYLQTGIVSRHVVGMNAAQHLLQSDRPIVVDTSFFSPFQVGIATVCHPTRSQLVIVKTYGTNSSGGVARLASLCTRCLLTHQASAGLFVDIDSFHCFTHLVIAIVFFHSAKIRNNKQTDKFSHNYLAFSSQFSIKSHRGTLLRGKSDFHASKPPLCPEQSQSQLVMIFMVKRNDDNSRYKEKGWGI